jgi:hypothetical protein
VTTSYFSFPILALVAICARGAVSASPSSTSAEVPATIEQPAAPLASLTSDALVVLPAQVLRMQVPDWSDKVGDPRYYLTKVDDEIAFALRERGLKAKWAFPEDLVRSSKRNPGYAVDPYSISVDPLAPVERDPEKHIGEPLASQLRAFAGLFNARYALIPVEMKLVPDAAGGRATLHLVLVDTRGAKLTWKGDVQGDIAKSFSPAIAAGLAGRVADLFIAQAR